MECPYCKGKVNTVHSSFIYGNNAPDYGLMVVCENYPKCDSYGGTTVASYELRELRKECHREFDKMWKSGERKRKTCYGWLCRKMHLTSGEGHIALFTENKCRKLLRKLKERLENIEKNKILENKEK